MPHAPSGRYLCVIAMDVQHAEFKQRVQDSRNLFDAYVRFLRREARLFHNEFEDLLASSWRRLLRTFDTSEDLPNEEEITAVRRASADYKRAQECFQEYDEAHGLTFDTEPLHAERFREHSELLQDLLNAASEQVARLCQILAPDQRTPARMPSPKKPKRTDERITKRIPRKLRISASEATPDGCRSGAVSSETRGPASTASAENSSSAAAPSFWHTIADPV